MQLLIRNTLGASFWLSRLGAGQVRRFWSAVGVATLAYLFLLAAFPFLPLVVERLAHVPLSGALMVTVYTLPFLIVLIGILEAAYIARGYVARPVLLHAAVVAVACIVCFTVFAWFAVSPMPNSLTMHPPAGLRYTVIAAASPTMALTLALVTLGLAKFASRWRRKTSAAERLTSVSS